MSGKNYLTRDEVGWCLSSVCDGLEKLDILRRRQVDHHQEQEQDLRALMTHIKGHVSLDDFCHWVQDHVVIQSLLRHMNLLGSRVSQLVSQSNKILSRRRHQHLVHRKWLGRLRMNNNRQGDGPLLDKQVVDVLYGPVVGHVSLTDVEMVLELNVTCTGTMD